MEIPDGYVILGETDGEYSRRTRASLKIDFSGYIALINATGDTISDWSIGYTGSIIKSMIHFITLQDYGHHILTIGFMIVAC